MEFLQILRIFEKWKQQTIRVQQKEQQHNWQKINVHFRSEKAGHVNPRIKRENANG